MLKGNQEGAIPFISFKEKQGFVLTQEAETFLKNVGDSKVGVICMVGKYRTGKSFFINRVLLDRVESGFSVGPTINPCTKGLWLWNQTLKSEAPEYEDMKILLIDTEGFGGMDENVNHDSRIFLFSLLLSSYFIFNSVGSIDENALNSLSLIINLAREIQIKSNSQENEKEDPANFFPAFLWVVRDFALKMVDTTGNPLLPRDYLEKALELQKGVSDVVESKNRIRRLFKHFFKDRDCITLVRPVESEKDLQKLDRMTNTELRPEFLDQMGATRKKIFKRVKPKMLNGRTVTGFMMLELAKAYLSAINGGGVPNIESAWNYLCKSETHKALQESLREVERELENMKDSPVEDGQLKEKKDKIRDMVLTAFKKKAIGSDEELSSFTEQFNMKFKEKLKEFREKNKEAWGDVYTRLTEPRSCEIEEKLRRDEYSNYYEFQNDMNLMCQDYEKSAPRGPSKSVHLLETTQKLYKLAAEYLSRRKEGDAKREARLQEQRMALLENEFLSKKREFSEEKKELQERLAFVEKEKAVLKANEENLMEKISTLKEERRRLEGMYNDLTISNRSRDGEIERLMQERIGQLEKKFENNRSDSSSTLVQELEKQRALLDQEVNFSKREIDTVMGKMRAIESENQRLKTDLISQEKNNEIMKRNLHELEVARANEMLKVKDDFSRKIEDLTEETDKKRDILKEHGKLVVEKTYLENQIAFLKNQLDENKRLHDALLIALQQGLSNNENENISELVDTNRNLATAMEKMEMRCKILEEKVERLKGFKKQVKNCSSLQCLHCQKYVTSSIFGQHLSACMSSQPSLVSSNPIGFVQNTQSFVQTQSQASSQPQLVSQSVQQLPSQAFAQNAFAGSSIVSTSSVTSSTSVAPSSISPLDTLLISINQTMVKESADSKPYTEYLIQVTFNGQKWLVAKKYKHFCELHQALSTSFHGFTFPDSAEAIVNSQTDMNNLFNPKRPTVIEERRKALQQFLRDLAKLDLIKNSKIFRIFLDIEGKGKEQQTSGPSSSASSQNPNGDNGINTSWSSSSLINSHRENSRGKASNFNHTATLGAASVDSRKTLLGNTYSARGALQEDNGLLNGASNNKNSFTSNLLLPEEGANQGASTQNRIQGDLNKIDKKLLPQSPQTFLRNWDANKENKNPKGKATSVEKGSIYNNKKNENKMEDVEEYQGDEFERADENINYSGINSSMNQNDIHETSHEKSLLGLLRSEQENISSQSRYNNKLLMSSKSGSLLQSELRSTGFLNSSQNQLESTSSGSQRCGFLQSSINSALSSFNNQKKKADKNATTSSVIINDRNGLRGLQVGGRNPAISSTNFSPQRSQLRSSEKFPTKYLNMPPSNSGKLGELNSGGIGKDKHQCQSFNFLAPQKTQISVSSFKN